MTGGVREMRMPYIYYSKDKTDSDIYFTYNNIIFCALLCMIIITGNYSKKFGDICYVFVVFIININDYMINLMITRFDEEKFFKFYFLLTVYNDILILLCIYLLVGSRVLNILINPKFDNPRSSNVDLKKYIPISLGFFSRNSNSTNESSTNNTIRDSKLTDNCCGKNVNNNNVFSLRYNSFD